MVAGAPAQARWIRAEPRHSLPTEILQRIADAAVGGHRVLSAEPLGDGLRNSNFKLRLDSLSAPLVLRIYEHDASLCQKEVDLWRLVGGAVPVPEVIHSEPRGWDDLPPFALLGWIDGISFRDLKRAGDTEAIAQAARAAGETLAAVGQFTFAKPGWIGPGPAVTAPLLEGGNAMPRFVDLCLETDVLRRRMPADLPERTHALMWSLAEPLQALERETSLVHGDFNRRNLLVARAGGRCRVAAVLDWEFAVCGSPLADVGSFLAYERMARPIAEPHFTAGFAEAGGRLPDDWRRLARVCGLAGLCESLSREQLPAAFVPELVELVRATVEDRDPRL